MDLSKFTERSRGFLEAAHAIATREGHQRLLPVHLLKALMDDEEGLAANLVRSAGGSPERVAAELDAALGKIPKVGGDAGQVYTDAQIGKVLAEAEAIARKAGDSFVAVERILTALAVAKGPARDALEAAGAGAKDINEAVNALRQGRTADSATAENAYDALRKYAADQQRIL